jgi:hypothetical protein
VGWSGQTLTNGCHGPTGRVCPAACCQSLKSRVRQATVTPGRKQATRLFNREGMLTAGFAAVTLAHLQLQLPEPRTFTRPTVAANPITQDAAAPPSQHGPSNLRSMQKNHSQCVWPQIDSDTFKSSFKSDVQKPCRLISSTAALSTRLKFLEGLTNGPGVASARAAEVTSQPCKALSVKFTIRCRGKLNWCRQ